jgi:hypothetical protein
MRPGWVVEARQGLWGELQADGCVESQTRFRWVKAFQEVRINQQAAEAASKKE